MLETIKLILKQLLNDLDSGNSSISEKELEEILNLFERVNRKELTRTEVANYLGVSVGTVDNYVNRGLIPEGIKRPGHVKIWYKKDLDNYLNSK